MSGAPVGNRVFAPTIFFIAFREALEASLVIGILTSMLETLVQDTSPPSPTSQRGRAQDGAEDQPQPQGGSETHSPPSETSARSDQANDAEQARSAERKALVRRLRKLVFAGAFSGLGVAAAIGAIFLAIFYTQANDLWGKAEELWEGVFTLIAVCLITPMSLAILRADRSRAKWRKKLKAAFVEAQALPEPTSSRVGTATAATAATAAAASREGSAATTSKSDEVDKSDMVVASSAASSTASSSPDEIHHVAALVDEKENTRPPKPSAAKGGGGAGGGLAGELLVHEVHADGATATRPPWWSRLRARISAPFQKGRRGALAIFVIPFVTVLREGLEGVVFIGGVSLGLPATSIPLPAVVGLAAGLLCGFVVFRAGSFAKIRIVLLGSTCALLLIAAGMAARCVWYLSFYRYVRAVGDAAAESGSGPGSYYYKDYVWHLDCCNPELKNASAGGWSVLNSILGWNNTATIGTILAYILYWVAVSTYLVYAMWKEGRLALVVPSSSALTSRLGRMRRRGGEQAAASDDGHDGRARRVVLWESKRAAEARREREAKQAARQLKRQQRQADRLDAHQTPPRAASPAAPSDEERAATGEMQVAAA